MAEFLQLAMFTLACITLVRWGSQLLIWLMSKRKPSVVETEEGEKEEEVEESKMTNLKGSTWAWKVNPDGYSNEIVQVALLQEIKDQNSLTLTHLAAQLDLQDQTLKYLKQVFGDEKGE